VKKNWLFLAKTIAISVGVFAVQPYIETCYLYALMYATNTPASENLPYVSAPGLCPFFIFILATPKLSTSRRIIALLSGITIFLALDLIMTLVWVPYFQTMRPSLRNMGSHYGYYVAAYYILPFLVWFGFAFRQIEEFFLGVTAENSK
jgi:hypothetical protein